jgi:hypothetical protein
MEYHNITRKGREIILYKNILIVEETKYKAEK